MMQEKVNELAHALLLQVIEALVKEDCVKYRTPIPEGPEMAYYIEFIDRLHCCTRKLPDLFRDAHEYHHDIGMMPHAATLADLEFCVKKRCIGYAVMQSVRYAWLPAKDDAMLRRLPAFIAIDRLYRENQKILPPTTEEEPLNGAVKLLADGLCAIKPEEQ